MSATICHVPSTICLHPYTDAYFECFVREYVSTVYHPVSTCAMGPREKNSGTNCIK